jgi:protein disulfide-isomerase A6
MAARHLAGDVKLGKVDSELNRKLQNKYGVTGFPSIKVFAPDDKENFEDYNGGRSAREIIDFALEKKKDYGKDYSAPKLDSHSTFLDTCDKKKTMCVLFMVENEE